MKIRGSALKPARSAKLEFSFKISEVHNKGIFVLSGNSKEEVGSIQSNNLGCCFLRDLATRVPAYGSGKMHFIGEVIRGRRSAERTSP